MEEAKRRKSVCSYYEEEDDDDTLPILKHHSALLENMHIEQVWLENPQVSFSTQYMWCCLCRVQEGEEAGAVPVLLV